MTLPLELGGVHDDNVRRAFEQIAQQFPVVATGGGGGGAPSGPAGGDLGSTYPNPTVVKGQAGFTVGGVAVTLATDPALTDARAPTAHHTTHEPGGTDAMAVDAAAATGSLRTIGTGALQATAGNDSRLTNARTPTAHATSHQPGGTDAMAVDAAAATGSLRTLGATATSAASGDRGLPVGGTSGQVLAKNSAANYDAGWVAAGGSPATVLTQYKTVMRGMTSLATQASAATLLASPFGATGAAGAAGTATWAFYLDPADLNFTGTTNKLRLRTSLHVNAVAPTGTITGALYPVATWGGASGTTPTIATLGTVTVQNAYAAPAANAHTRTDSADVNFPTAGWFVFVLANSAAMASGSQVVMLYELQARQV